MARRRRLEPPSPLRIADLREAASPGEDDPSLPLRERRVEPPIARVAADAADAQRREIEALRDAAERLAAAEADGLVIRDVPLEAIDVDYLARDRLPRIEDDEAARALRQSIELHGQRTPLDLADLGPASARRFGLVSGYRRFGALQRLARETGDARWRTARAVVRTPRTLGAAFVAMVEENEIREGLSYFERGQVCLRAAEQGAFSSVDAALDALFQSASPAKRSKIRSFVLIAETLGDVLRRPEALGERLGLRIAQAIRDGQAGALRTLLGERLSQTRSAADEQAALSAALAGVRRLRAQKPRDVADRQLPEGGVLAVRRRRDRIVIEIRGLVDGAPLSEGAIAALVAPLRGAGDADGR